MDQLQSDRLQNFVSRKATLVIEGNHLVVMVREHQSDEESETPFMSSKFYLREDNDPWQIDIENGLFVVLPGIIKVDGDIIRLCFYCKQDATETKRPKEFQAGPDVFYVEAKRM